MFDAFSAANICHHMLTSSTQLQNRSFHVVERTRTSSKCQKMKNARAKRAKILFFIVKYANLWGFCCRRRRSCLSSLLYSISLRDRGPRWFVFIIIQSFTMALRTAVSDCIILFAISLRYRGSLSASNVSI